MPVTLKAKLMRQVLGKRKEVYSSAGHLRRWGLLFQNLSHISVPAEVFVRREREGQSEKIVSNLEPTH